MLSRDRIERVIPIQPPVLAIDRIANVQKAFLAISEWDIREDAWWTQGHFPSNPILPGTQIIESMAQTAPFCFYDEAKPQPIEGMLVRVDDVKFVRPVTPPCTLIVKAERMGAISQLAKFRCRAFVKQSRVAIAELTIHFNDESLVTQGVGS